MRITRFFGLFVGISAVFAGLAMPLQAQSLITSITQVLPEPAPVKPKYLTPFTDPNFGLPIQRVTDSATLNLGGAVPVYSQSQAWNADQTLILLRSNDLLDAKTFKIVHKIDFGWPAFGTAVRWSPTDPNMLYYTGGVVSGQKDALESQCSSTSARLWRYRLVRGGPIQGVREIAHCFTEYTSILKDPSYEELSDDGRYIALVGHRADGHNEVFAYDLTTNTKFATLSTPDDATGHPREPDWAGMSPSGKYVLIMWAKGIERYYGMEAYDRATMNYLGKVTASSGHGDLAMDAKGNEYYVCTNGNNAYFLTGKHYIVRSSIPNGVVFNTSGVIDPVKTVSSEASVPLVSLSWNFGVHVSCRGILSPVKKGCIVSTEAGGDSAQPFLREIFYVDLDSRAEAPIVERLAHHHSDVEYARSLPDAQCPLTSYWIQPHATLSPDGTKVIFGSSWGKACSAESYILDLSSIRQGTRIRNPGKPLPGRLNLGVFPNPVRAASNIRIFVPEGVSGAEAQSGPGKGGSLVLIDRKGRQVRSFSRSFPGGFGRPGEHSLAFDGLDDSGKLLAPGVYFLALNAPGLEAGARFALIR